MFIKEKKQTHLFKILEDNQFAKLYFKDKKLENYNSKNLMELQNQLELAKKEYDIYLTLLTKATVLLGIKFLIKYALDKTTEKKQILDDILIKNEYFESDLIYLFITNKITVKQFKDLGYDDEYITNLYNKYTSEIDNQYITYYYDELTGKTYERTTSGNYVCLSKTPDIVKSEILNLKKENGNSMRLKK